jgi:hypothetical protein
VKEEKILIDPAGMLDFDDEFGRDDILERDAAGQFQCQAL